MALDTSAEFSKHKDARQVVFHKDYRKGKTGPVRFKKGETHFMHKDVAEKVKDYAKITEVDWKGIHGKAKEVYRKASKNSEDAQTG